MNIDFFNDECAEPEKNDTRFGICDNQDGGKAFTNNNNENIWIATIDNPNGRVTLFRAIDNCLEVFKPNTLDQESTCDGMLTFSNTIFLFELKNQGTRGWRPKAISQLENTIRLLQEHHDLEYYRYKKAFACNRRHPRFSVIDHERKKRFYNDSGGFRLDIRATIEIE